MCLDDDASVDENAINELYEYMEKKSGCRDGRSQSVSQTISRLHTAVRTDDRF